MGFPMSSRNLNDITSWMSRKPNLFTISLLFFVSYIPLLLSAPGLVPGDTKLYLYLDPWRLISDSLWTWDNRQLGGWVPHQNIGYLWPSGPWFGAFDALGVPDWIAHRLWLGTMLFSAGMGTLWFARRFGMRQEAATIAALAYQLSPFVLPYISRTSALLLPWALLPWLCGLTLDYARQRRGIHLFLFGLVLFSSGGLNATALLMIAPGPLIWLIHLWRSGEITAKGFFRVTGILGFVSVLVSAWWLTGLLIQGRYGAAVLSYSEALASTAFTSTAPEVLRGLGYWLFYDRNEVVSLTSASTPYQGNLVVMAAGGALVLLGLWGIGNARRWRWPLMSSVLVGTFLAIGAYPFHDPSPLWSFAVDNPRNALSLALRSSSRAVPVVILALAIGIGLAMEKISTASHNFFGATKRKQVIAYLSVVTLIALNLPALFGGRLIDPAMTRPNDLPAAWYEAAAFLDQRFDEGYTGSVLLLPGIESAAYRWGYPVDPILPGLSKKPFLSRDWLPLGSAPLMDLVYALDDSFQSGTARAEAVAPIARLLGADTVMVVNSHQYERFGTIRPERARSVLNKQTAGLTFLTDFGPNQVNESRAKSESNIQWSEEILAFPPQALPEIELFAVNDPAPVARTTSTPGVLAGDGTGAIDLASLGLIDGQSILLSEAALSDAELQTVLSSAPEVFVTDSNRRRAHHWRSSQEVWGATETATGLPLVEDLFDSRLPVFPNAIVASQTVVAPSNLTARATAYGPELTFHPENRPTMAIDGDVSTAWQVGTSANPVGEILEVVSSNQDISRLRLIQPQFVNPLRWITAVDLQVDDGRWMEIDLRPSSRTSSGQIVELDQPGRKISLRIAAIDWIEPFNQDSGPSVGFAEILEKDLTSPEVIQVPGRIQTFERIAPPTSYVFNRWRADDFARWRSDPEMTLQRSFITSHEANFKPTVQIRLNKRASDQVLYEALNLSLLDGELLNLNGTSFGANSRLQGDASWWGLGALDGDRETQWWTAPPIDQMAHTIPILTVPLSNTVTFLEIEQVMAADSSRLTGITLEFVIDGEVVESVQLDVPPPDEIGVSRLEVPARSSDFVRIHLSGIDPVLIVDSESGVLTTAPVGIREISSDGWSQVSPPEQFDTGCRTDLLSLDGQGVPLRLSGSLSAALTGQVIEAEFCSDSVLRLGAGEHRISSRSGLLTGWDVDAVAYRDTDRTPIDVAEPANTTFQRGQRTIQGLNCPSGCWLEVFDGWNTGWSASLGDTMLDEPRSSSGGRNVWFLDSAETSSPLEIVWTPQKFMWWALATSLSTLLVLAVMALRSSRSRVVVPQAAFEPPLDPMSSRKTLSAGGVGLSLLIGFLVISPFWGLIVAALSALLRRHLRLLGVMGWGLVALGLAFLLAQQIRTGAEPGFSWPSIFARAHRPTLAGLVLLWVVATTDQYRVRKTPGDSV